MAEQILYSDNFVSVSTTRVVIGGTTYALRNISSVQMRYSPPRRGCAFALLILAVIAFIANAVNNQGVGAVVVFVFLGVPSLLWVLLSKKHYHIIFSTNAGEVEALTSKDEQYIGTVVEAINQAIIHH